MILSKDVQNGLGLSTGSTILIVHADDVGLCKSVNESTEEAMRKGAVTSGSIMVPCPAFEEAAAVFSKNTSYDIGIHITLTCEFEGYKWGPVSDPDKVPSLLNSEGHFFDDPQIFAQNAKPKEVEIEIRAQLSKAMECGLKPTHLDSHMFVVENHLGAFNAYLKVGHEYNLKCLLDKQILRNPLSKRLIKPNAIVADEVIMAYADDLENGLSAFYTEVISNLGPGLYVLLIHPAYDNNEMRRIAEGNFAYGSAWRQEDFDFFTSEACENLIKDKSIHLSSWGELAMI